MFSVSQKNKILNSKKIYLLGRGPTAKYLNYKTDKNVYISINLKKKNYINIDKEKILSSKNKIKVGSVFFGLYAILTEINNLLHKYKVYKKVYLYGFDFIKYTEDEDIAKKIFTESNLQQAIDINSQQIGYEIIENNFSNLDILKCGFDIASDINPKTNKSYYRNKTKLEIVAELTTNHQGNTDRLENLILGCINAGCKIIKFQKRHVETFYPKHFLNRKYTSPFGKSFYDYRKHIELTTEQIDLIKYYEKKKDLKIIFSALDVKSYIDLKKHNFKYFKIPSTISSHKKYINFISKENLQEIIVSTGMTNNHYVNFILNKFKKVNKLYLLHAISTYPCSFADINLNIVKKFSSIKRNVVPGYSSHDPGYYGSMLAIGAGAIMIEKHVKTGITDWVHYDDAAIDVKYEFPKFIKTLERSYQALGSKTKVIYPHEHHKYDFKK